jgi:prepilin-type N-terminal cleavage/methylation domain-containing protein
MTILHCRRGFTLIEMIVVIAVIAVLASIITPMIAKYLEDSKISRAVSDVKMIGAAIGDFYKDNARWPIFIDPTIPLTESNSLLLLLGVGRDAAMVTRETLDTKFWNEVGGWPAHRIDRLEDHLVYNEPPTHQYNPLKWKGPYLSKITADPWGNHYSVNTAYLTNFYPEGEVVWVISAGKNETWETNFRQLNSSATTVGGDDISFRIK